MKWNNQQSIGRTDAWKNKKVKKPDPKKNKSGQQTKES